MDREFCSLRDNNALARREREIADRWAEVERLEQALAEPYPFSDRAEDYVLTKYNYMRNNPRERKYVDKYKNYVLILFKNTCAYCRSTRALDLDHHWIAKSTGGMFVMEHRDGHMINNMIPLCTTCNRKKKDKSYKLFCDGDRLEEIHQLNSIITRKVNEEWNESW